MPTWSSVITAVSIPSTIAVYGNGMALGLTNGTTNLGITGPSDSASTAFSRSIEAYGSNVGTTVARTKGANSLSFGITSDSTKSGMVAKSNSITRTSKSFKFCIKY